MPRLTLKFLVKSLVLVVIIMFLVPFLVSHMDSQEEEKAAHNQRRKIIKKDLEKQMQAKDVLDQHENKLDLEIKKEGDGQVVEPPVKVDDQDQDQGEQVVKPNGKNEKEATKVYGPKAVFKQGEIGNFEPVVPETKGPGEGGQAVLVSMEEKPAGDQSVREYGFNMVASDKIAMNRTIPDTRMPECKYWHYPEKLPTASVIIVFHNEGWSTLLRTIHSIIDTSPPHLLHEVVMVDDFSDKAHLKQPLDDYIVKTFNGKVKLFRNEKRLGLIRTRTLGARYSTGDVIVYLDAHCECNRNWLPPLLSRIAYDRTIMTVPIVDGIEWDSFRYSSVYGSPSTHFRGIFEWGFLYKESNVPQKELQKREHNSEPYWAPTHAGGLFAMDRKYFQELGEYDEGLQIWGGENFELSFKIWLCGGSIEWVPCSRVGHVYRNHMPYGFGDINPKIPVIQLNYMRVVEVWLDEEFRDYFYTREPMIKGYPIGEIEKQKEFRAKNCPKSFKWFMDNVAYEVYEKFPPPPPNHGWGEVKELDGIQCWDTMGSGPLGTYQCHHQGGNQMFRLNVEGQLAVGERCIDAKGSELHVVYCPVKPNGPWKWDEEGTKQIIHSSTGKCVQANTNGNRVSLETCSDTKSQQWVIQPVWTWK